MPKLSIITVVKNAESYIDDCILSIKQFTNIDFEHIVVDGFSNDSTWRRLKELTYDKLRCYQINDNSLYEAMNYGVDNARGNLVLFSNVDDRLDSYGLEKLLVLIGSTGSRWGHADVLLIDENNIKIGVSRSFDQPMLYKASERSMPLNHPTLVVQRDLFNSIGGFNLSYRLSADYDFVLKLLKSTSKGCYLKKPVAYYRVGGRSFSVESLLESLKVQREHGISAYTRYSTFIKSFLVLSISRLVSVEVILQFIRGKSSRHGKN